MIARKRIDISVTDALQGLLVHCWSGGNAPWLTERTRQLEQRWHTTRAPFHSGCLVTLSVRTAFDLFLRALQLPAGSVVLMSAVTIKDMGDVVAQNGFVPVPVDLSPRTMAPALEDIVRLFDQLERDGSRVRVVCIAHLLGTVVDMETIVFFAHERGAVVFEDCAQAFKGSVVLAREPGDVRADAVAWSFGIIKTAAAAGGGIVSVRDAPLLARMRELAAALPTRERANYARRLQTAAAMSFLLRPLPYRLLWCALHLVGRSMDSFLLELTRAFPGARVVDLVRFAPEGSLAWLMDKRVQAYEASASAANDNVRRRIAIGKRICAGLPAQLLVAGIDEVERNNHSFWLLGVFVDQEIDIPTLISDCHAARFDVTSGSSQLVALPVPAGLGHKISMHELLKRFIYLPALPEMSNHDADRLCATLRLSVQRQLASKSQLCRAKL
jgi:dTDP-4-amino-4,6-dideoxygalactose transaminase